MMMPGRKFFATHGYRCGFNGKEMDNEVKGDGNQYDYGFRIYDARLGRWLSVDPLQNKFPNESPYIYTSNNPVLYIDPDGRFKIPIHKRIIANAFKISGLCRGWKGLFMKEVKFGATIDADILGADANNHFDGRKNFIQVQKTWNKLNSHLNSKIDDLGSFNRKYGGDDAVLFGRMLHTVQDFYSHSNYVELYIEYFKGSHDGSMPTSVPIYDDG